MHIKISRIKRYVQVELSENIYAITNTQSDSGDSIDSQGRGEGASIDKVHEENVPIESSMSKVDLWHNLREGSQCENTRQKAAVDATIGTWL